MVTTRGSLIMLPVTPTDPEELREWIKENNVTIAELEIMDNLFMERLIKSLSNQIHYLYRSRRSV